MAYDDTKKSDKLFTGECVRGIVENNDCASGYSKWDESREQYEMRTISRLSENQEATVPLVHNEEVRELPNNRQLPMSHYLFEVDSIANEDLLKSLINPIQPESPINPFSN